MSKGIYSLTFSSPMVRTPWVFWFCSAKAASFLIAGDCDTARRNLTFDLVYSWPLCPHYQFLQVPKKNSEQTATNIDFCVVR